MFVDKGNVLRTLLTFLRAQEKRMHKGIPKVSERSGYKFNNNNNNKHQLNTSRIWGTTFSCLHMWSCSIFRMILGSRIIVSC